MMNAKMDNKNIAALAELIHGIQIAMLTTKCQDGSLRSRPMATLDRDFDGALYFFTDKDEPKVTEIRSSPQVNLSYANPSRQSYVSISGHAQILHDRPKIYELWKPLYKAWFPQGVDDGQIALIQVDADQAEYWETNSSKIVQLVGFVKAVLTGQSFQPGENKKVDVHAGESTR